MSMNEGGPSASRFGFPAGDWEKAKAQAAAILVAHARRRGTTTYGALCRDISAIRLRPSSWALVAFLDEICAEEDEFTGTALASLVVHQGGDGLPGEGYFAHAERVGLDVSDRRAFWQAEVEKVFAAWGEGEEGSG